MKIETLLSLSLVLIGVFCLQMNASNETAHSVLKGVWRYSSMYGVRAKEFTYKKLETLPSFPKECKAGEYHPTDLEVSYMVFHLDNKVSRYFVTSYCTRIISEQTFSYDERSLTFKIDGSGLMKLSLENNDRLHLRPGEFYDTWVLKTFPYTEILQGEPYHFRFEKIERVVKEEQYVSCMGFNYESADKFQAYTFTMDDSYIEYMLYHDLVKDTYCMEFSTDEGMTFTYADRGTGPDEIWFHTNIGVFNNETHFEANFKNNHDHLYIRGI